MRYETNDPFVVTFHSFQIKWVVVCYGKQIQFIYIIEYDIDKHHFLQAISASQIISYCKQFGR